MPAEHHKTEQKRWTAETLFPESLPPVFTLDKSISEAARERLNYMCHVLHSAINALDSEGPLTLIVLCHSIRVPEPDFRFIWATFFLGGYDGLRQEAIRPTSAHDDRN